MNKRLISLMATALALLSAAGQVSFAGPGVEEHKVIEITPARSTGLDKIFVIYNTDGVAMTYTSTLGAIRTRWCTFDANNWSYPDTLRNTVWDRGANTTLNQVKKNTGYIIQDGHKRYYYWVINYADYHLSLYDLFIQNDRPCDFLNFRVDGEGGRIPYSTTTGQIEYLDGDIKLYYNTLVWDDDATPPQWVKTPTVSSFISIDNIQIEQPLCNTSFKLTGDFFLREWAREEGSDVEEAVTESVPYYTKAVKCNSDTTIITSGKVDSAPVEIIFTGYPTQAVVYRAWEMATDPEFENIILTYNQNEVDYTFNESGTYYMRYKVANEDGTCEDYGETYTISVGESELVCPNAFSPGTTPEINDVWKVKYKSLIEFHCWIFNRWGNLVCEFTDPDEGWDGTYHGKLVDTGVYYYVITAVGSDGKTYKNRGDITILRYKRGTGGADTGGLVPDGGGGTVN